MKNMSSALQSIILFTFLAVVGGSLHYILYQEEYKLINRQTDYLYHVEKERLFKYLKTYSNVLDSYQNDLETLKSFDPKYFEDLAQKFLIHFSDTKAFNFIDSNYKISHINPLLGNEVALGKNLLDHPDTLIRDIFRKGLPRKGLSFIPPVEIYQGGRAIIFYVPIQFKSGEYGWINVVILAEKLFHNYQQGLGILNFSFSVLDKETGRYYFKENSFSMDDNSIISFDSNIFGRDITYQFNLKGQYSFLRSQSIKEYLFYLIIAFFLSFIFFLYSKGRQNLYNEFINISNESNLLKTLIHDISTPGQVVLLGLQHLDLEKSFNQELVDSLIRHQTLTAEVIHTVRKVFSGKAILDQAVSVDLGAVVNGFLEDYQKRIGELGLKVDIQIKETSLIATYLDPMALKNHVLRNLVSNAIKFATPESTLTIVVGSQSFVVMNHHELLSDSRLKELNDIKPMDSSLDNSQKTSLGFGMFIAKIFCRHANIKYLVTQNKKDSVISTRLDFPSL